MQEKEHIPKQRAAAPEAISPVKQPPAAIGTSAVENTEDAQLPVRDAEMAKDNRKTFQIFFKQVADYESRFFFESKPGF